LIAALCGGERALGGEPVAVVGLALQRGEVVQHRGPPALLFLLELGDRAREALAGRRAVCRRAVWLPVICIDVAPARRHDRVRLLLGGDAGTANLLGRADARLEAALVGALALGEERRVDEPR